MLAMRGTNRRRNRIAFAMADPPLKPITERPRMVLDANLAVMATFSLSEILRPALTLPAKKVRA